MTKTPKRPRDPNQLAHAIIGIASGDMDDVTPTMSPTSDLARLGGLKGGRARAAAMTPERRAEIARTAALKRWNKKGP